MSNSPNYLEKERDIKYFLQCIVYLINLVNESSLLISDKNNLVSIIQETYNSKLREYLIENEHKRMGKQEKCKECEKTHGISETIYELFDKIEKEISSIR